MRSSLRVCCLSLCAVPRLAAGYLAVAVVMLRWLLVVVLLSVARLSFAQGSGCPGYDAGVQWCADQRAQIGTSYQSGSCSNPWTTHFVWSYVGMNGSQSAFVMDGAACPAGWTPPPSNPCSSIAPANVYLTGKILTGYSIPENATDPMTGGTVQCAMSVTPIGVPTMRSDGTWETYGSVAPSGNLASGSGWTDGNGAAVNPQPPIPTLPATNVTAPPSVCSGSSCYNAGTNQYCGSAGGQQYCVSGATATSSTGGCTASGSAAVCAGQAVIPPPPSAIIPDPSTQIQGSDKYTQASPTTGAAMVVTVNAYGLPGTKVTSGQQSGDAGPASATSSGGSTNGTFGGGQDCQTPPVCSGDMVMCGAARTQWATTCQVHKDLAGTTAPPSLTDGAHTAADVWSDGTSTGNSTADAANAGNYDLSGMGFATACPLHDMQVPLPGGRSFAIKFSAGCEVGGWLKAIIIAFALFAAARITAGGVG